MPSSRIDQISFILSAILEKHFGHQKIKSVLDVGIGWGKYGLLMREYLTITDIMKEKNQWTLRLDGIEVFEKYLHPHINELYDRIYITDICEFCESPKTWIHSQTWDLVLLIDLLEHMPKEDGLQVINTLKKYSMWILISTPTEMEKQPAHLFHELEQHVCVWRKDDFSPFKIDKIYWNRGFLLLMLRGDLWRRKKESTFLIIPPKHKD